MILLWGRLRVRNNKELAYRPPTLRFPLCSKSCRELDFSVEKISSTSGDHRYGNEKQLAGHDITGSSQDLPFKGTEIIRALLFAAVSDK
jgi:hypothetical protein